MKLQQQHLSSGPDWRYFSTGLTLVLELALFRIIETLVPSIKETQVSISFDKSL